MKALSVFFALILFAFAAPIFGQVDAGNDALLEVRLEPAEAGKLNVNLAKDSTSSDIPPSQVEFSLDLFAGWKCVDTVIGYDESGNPTALKFVAERLSKSAFADTVIISEIFFCAHLADSLSNWFELTNISDREIRLKNAMIQTAAGKQYITTELLLPPKSCVKVGADSLMMNFRKDSLFLVDSANRIISTMEWDTSIMNLPQDSIFSLEIIDVFKSASDVSNWEIIYGAGRGGLCPEKYTQSLGEDSIWNWLQFVVWGIAAVLLILILGLSLKKRKK
ncbi:MAG: hypothetical protein PF448_00495 [Bacteroidales bacterium]|jgi:hypothetical protein|nr:hypothetical protein [Bacteroidales bacterium]